MNKLIPGVVGDSCATTLEQDLSHIPAFPDSIQVLA
jgi:hypothetical protein